MKPHRGQWKAVLIPKEKKIKVSRTRIKQKGDLKATLRNESYDKIGIWADGVWADVGTSYDGEQDVKNPAAYITRSMNYDLTWKEINGLVSEKEDELNNQAV